MKNYIKPFYECIDRPSSLTKDDKRLSIEQNTTLSE